MFGVNLDLKFLINEIGEAQEVSLSPIPIPFLIHRSCSSISAFSNHQSIAAFCDLMFSWLDS
jgi:hypothetical protein